MAMGKKTRDSYRLDSGACPMPSRYDSTHRSPSPAALPHTPARPAQKAIRPNRFLRNTQPAIYRKADAPYTKLVMDRTKELLKRTSLLPD